MEKEYRNWLTRHCDLYDQTTWEYHELFDKAVTHRLTGQAVEFFSSHPREPVYRDKDSNQKSFRQKPPSFVRLAAHRNARGYSTILVSNTFANARRPHILLMLADVDAKHGEPDAQELAQFVRDRFLGGRGYIEPSRSGKGRHVYFLCDCEFLHPVEIKRVIDELKARMKTSVSDAGFKANVNDGIMGVPTAWQGDKIVYRGNVLKLPYLPSGQDDFDRLRSLEAVLISELSKDTFIPTSHCSNGNERTEPNPTQNGGGEAIVIAVRTLGRTNTLPENLHSTGWRKKIRLVSQHLIRTNGRTPDLNALYAEYMASCQPTIEAGDTQKRMAVLEKVVTHLQATFRPSSGTFDRNRYLPLVTDLVPPLAFVWNRREKIDHQRLADFIAVKISDADFGFQFGRVARDTTLKRFKALKAKGIVDWVPGNNQYAKLLTLATGYGLLEVFEQHERPSHVVEGMKIVRRKGRARCIGPGVALPDERARFVITYEKIRPTQEVKEIA